MRLKDFVALYRTRAGGYGRVIHLSELGLSREEVERELSAFEEDYQISRFLQLSRAPDAEIQARAGAPRLYTINGYEYSHLAIQAEIDDLL